MTTITATEAKNRLGEYIEKAQREPISIEKSGRKCAILISQEEYERLQAYENRYWADRAKEAQARGDYVGHEEAMALLLQGLKDRE